ncbi:carboxy terminal-processing peptidase [Melioribacteraceae bacterium 4301-Me]|uniref:carboxy terminal-processing peptidase n=1 Tax=Pyranulibacter aquaticus TaxID=3163344 RepID=UPI003594C025
MKRLLFIIFFSIVVLSCKAQNPEAVIAKDHTIDTNKVLYPNELLSRKDQIITNLLTNYHYRKLNLNDSISAVIYENYLNALDNNKLYFLKADIEKFNKYKYNFDDNLKIGNLYPAFEIFNTFKKRLGERVKYINQLLKKQFDFTKDEYFQPDRKNADWAADSLELNELWRLRLKNDALNLILSGKDWNGVVDVLTKRYNNYYKIILQYEPEDVFQLYMNSYTEVYDPHTDYFSPITSDNFAIQMSLSLEGIGASLRTDGDYTVVASIIAGGPAAKSNLLHEGDKIIGVAQGKDGEMVDIIGWRLDDAIQLIRGKKGTVVRLSILKKEDGINAIPKEITLVRDKIKLEEQAAKSEIINVKNNGSIFKIGVIKLPSFYSDFAAAQKGIKDYKSTTTDVKKILEDFKKENVNGVIIDLRNNGGGSLQEAIQLTGLFIKEGPVVQVKNSAGGIEVDKDPDPSIFYDGPLAVLVNRFSASASEIFSGAIQDYGRGLIIGSNTYGKGTVQNVIDLSRFLPTSDGKTGEVKLTIAKFYRITGSSTQLKGVKPDIIFPSNYDSTEFGESSQPSALPWDQIQSTLFTKYGDIQKYVPSLIKKHNERIKNDPEYLSMLEDINESKEMRNKKVWSLNEQVRRIEKQKMEEKKKELDQKNQNQAELKLKNKNEVITNEEDAKDFELKETGRILADYILAKVG